MGRRIPYDFVADGSRLTFVRQTVVSDFNNGIRGKSLYKCVCGNTVELNPSNVKNGNTISCGCFHSERTKQSNTRHGLKNHPLYVVWKGMKGRCYNRRNAAYKYYGAKGIQVCEEWKNDFKAFHDWAMANGWREGREIDKDIIPKRLGIPATEYSPSMCSIVTLLENANAKTINHQIEFRGVTKNVSEWSRQLGFGATVILTRLKLGWDIEKILTTPVKKVTRRKMRKTIKS